MSIMLLKSTFFDDNFADFLPSLYLRIPLGFPSSLSACMVSSTSMRVLVVEVIFSLLTDWPIWSSWNQHFLLLIIGSVFHFLGYWNLSLLYHQMMTCSPCAFFYNFYCFRDFENEWQSFRLCFEPLSALLYLMFSSFYQHNV